MTALLLDMAIKGAVVLTATALVSRALGGRPAAVRHLVWAVGLTSLALLPALVVALPHWRLPVLPAAQVAGAAGAAGAGPGAGGWALVAWLLGAVAAGSTIVVGRARVWWLARGSVPVTDPDWLSLCSSLRRRIGLSREVAVRTSDRVAVPMVWGVARPVILLPAGAGAWPRRLRRDVLLHELVHVKRHDYATQLLGRLGCAIHWFDPLAWLAARRLREERERACDDHVLAAGADACDYAASLVEMARSMGRARRTAHAVPMAEPSRLGERVAALLDPRHRRAIVTRGTVLRAGLVAGLVVGPLASVQPGHRDAVAPAHADPVRAWAAAADVDGDGVVTVYRAPAIHVRVGGVAPAGSADQCEESSRSPTPPTVAPPPEPAGLPRIATRTAPPDLH